MWGEGGRRRRRWLQTALWERHGVRTLRRSLQEVASDCCARLSPDGALHVDGGSPPHLTTWPRVTMPIRTACGLQATGNARRKREASALPL